MVSVYDRVSKQHKRKRLVFLKRLIKLRALFLHRSQTLFLAGNDDKNKITTETEVRKMKTEKNIISSFTLIKEMLVIFYV